MTSLSSIKRGYVDCRFGQVHFFETNNSGDVDPAQSTVYCMHATAYSGQTFLPLMEAMRARRHVIALDTPGYGSSDAPPSEIDIAGYAEAMAEAIQAIEARKPNGAKPADILGFHTGVSIGAEMAVLYPKLVRKLVLIGIPFFMGEDKVAWRKKLVHTTQLTESFEQFHARWDYFVTNRAPGLSLSRGFDNFVDELRSYPRDWWAHKALFDYLPEERFPFVQAPVQIINPTGSLAEFSRNAAALFKNVSVVELPQVKGPPFDFAPDILASEMEKFLTAI